MIYLRWGIQAPDTVKDWHGVSWLLGGALTGDGLHALASGLHAVAGITIVACAVAIGFAPSAPGWWRPLAIAGGVVGIASFAVFSDGQTQLLVQEGGIGVAASLILLASAIAFAGAFS